MAAVGALVDVDVPPRDGDGSPTPAIGRIDAVSGATATVYVFQEDRTVQVSLAKLRLLSAELAREVAASAGRSRSTPAVVPFSQPQSRPSPAAVALRTRAELPNPWVTCPLDANHVMPLSTFQKHIAVCRQRNPRPDLRDCPYNFTHIIAEHLFDDHVANCPDRPDPTVSLYPTAGTPPVASVASSPAQPATPSSPASSTTAASAAGPTTPRLLPDGHAVLPLGADPAVLVVLPTYQGPEPPPGGCAYCRKQFRTAAALSQHLAGAHPGLPDRRVPLTARPPAASLAARGVKGGDETNGELSGRGPSMQPEPKPGAINGGGGGPAIVTRAAAAVAAATATPIRGTVLVTNADGTVDAVPVDISRLHGDVPDAAAGADDTAMPSAKAAPRAPAPTTAVANGATPPTPVMSEDDLLYEQLSAQLRRVDVTMLPDLSAFATPAPAPASAAVTTDDDETLLLARLALQLALMDPAKVPEYRPH